MSVKEIVAKITVPCLMPVGDEGKCTVATVDQFGPELADRFLRALDAAGYVIVPKEPTRAMVEALSKAVGENRDPGPAAAAWYAMLRAHQ